ncbi:MAG: NifB/NifX family molybdenum-iron cluster-binding protein [Candidatus Bathyarchaeia archaeon]
MTDKPLRVAAATKGYDELDDSINEFGCSKTFTIIEVEKGDVKKVEVMENPAATLSHGRGPVAAKNLVEKEVDVVIAGEIGPGASAMLKELGIEKITAKTGEKVLDALREKGLVKD